MAGPQAYAPTTFEERGAAVAFTTPLLSQTRIRRDERERLEILIPSFAEGRGVYIVPWGAVLDLTAMTAHDRFLHMMIERGKDGSPEAIRQATLKAARSGLAGPYSAAAARNALAVDDADRAHTHVALIGEVVRASGVDMAAIARDGEDAEKERRLTRAHLAKAAASAGIDPNELYRRIAAMAEVVYPLGLGRAANGSRLRQRLKDINELHQSLCLWLKADASDVTYLAQHCANVAADTAEFGRDILNEFDRRTDHIGAVVRDWGQQAEVFRRFVSKLTWLVDGWEYLCSLWMSALDLGVADQRGAIEEMFRVLPLIPRNEIRDQRGGETKDQLEQCRRSIRRYEEWNSSRLDREEIQRIEQVKRRLLERRSATAS